MSRRSVSLRRLARSNASLFRDGYFFCEKTSCVAHFHVEAGPDGRFPTDQAAGLLAMYCTVRRQSPRDYVVLVPAEVDELKGLYEKTDKLLQVGQSVHSQARLTRREEEVLDGLSRGLTNKEIAISLNLSERTVKFHVSSLLAKFNVRRRTELAHACYMPRVLQTLNRATPRIVQPISKTVGSYVKELKTGGLVPVAKRQIMA